LFRNLRTRAGNLSLRRRELLAVQSPHHADARVHQRPAIFRRHDKRFGRRLPFRKILLSLRQLYDVGGGVLKGDQLGTAGAV
jgi:hypothetical protein